MSKQAPVRSWSRLSSLRSTPAPESHPPSASTPSSQPSQPSSQNQNVASPFAPSLKPSQERSTSSLDNIANATNSLLPTTTMSQKLKLTTPPPPSSKSNVNPEIEPKMPVEEEPKNMPVNKIIEKPSVNDNGSLEKRLHKKLSDSENSNIRVITIAGENKGAYMEIIQSRRKPNYLHKKGNSKPKANDHAENCDNDEGNANRKDKNHKVRTISSSLPRNGVYINSNVQCVNNSLMFHSSCTSHDPGVQLTLSKKPFGEGFHLKKHVNGQHN